MPVAEIVPRKFKLIRPLEILAGMEVKWNLKKRYNKSIKKNGHVLKTAPCAFFFETKIDKNKM